MPLAVGASRLNVQSTAWENWLWLIARSVMLAVYFGMWMLYRVLGVTISKPLYLVSGAFMAVIGLYILYWRLKLRLLRQIERNWWLLCPRCRYPLATLSARGACPECGLQYTFSRVRRAWLRDFTPWTPTTRMRLRDHHRREVTDPHVNPRVARCASLCRMYTPPS